MKTYNQNVFYSNIIYSYFVQFCIAQQDSKYLIVERLDFSALSCHFCCFYYCFWGSGSRFWLWLWSFARLLKPWALFNPILLHFLPCWVCVCVWVLLAITLAASSYFVLLVPLLLLLLLAFPPTFPSFFWLFQLHTLRPRESPSSPLDGPNDFAFFI